MVVTLRRVIGMGVVSAVDVIAGVLGDVFAQSALVHARHLFDLIGRQLAALNLDAPPDQRVLQHLIIYLRNRRADEHARYGTSMVSAPAHGAPAGRRSALRALRHLAGGSGLGGTRLRGVGSAATGLWVLRLR